jgi:sugar fermentation stimulation protein A
MYRFTSALIRGRLIKRYKRFLADIALDSGELITAHCPNTGAMTGCANADTLVYLSKSDSPKRKYRYTWEYSTDMAGHRIGINTTNANRVVKDALVNSRIAGLEHYTKVVAEQKFGDSRIDFKLTKDGEVDAYVEVKSVTLADKQTALFPDTVTARGRKHCIELASIAQQGHRAYLFFCIQRENINAFKLARHIDPMYAQALDFAKENGMKVLAYGCSMSELGIVIANPVEISE